MLKFRLNKDRAQLVGSGPFRAVVFELIKVAEREGWRGKLIAAAREYVPGNAALQQFCRDYPHLLED
jgi:hypothetical protein